MNHNFRYILEEPLISSDGLELLASITELPIDEAEKLTDDEIRITRFDAVEMPRLKYRKINDDDGEEMIEGSTS